MSIITYLLIITLNGLNPLIKRHRVAEWILKRKKGRTERERDERKNERERERKEGRKKEKNEWTNGPICMLPIRNSFQI